uniref:LamG-like jellyroll fold domain-containing protein n=1 Tax=Brachyspira sp. TaxID=1977261 RepID=UPI003D7ECBA0
MRYINIILFILCINLNGEVYNIFSNGNGIYYSSLDNSANGFVLNNSLTRNYNNLEISEIFESSIVNSVNYSGVSYSKDIKFIDGVLGGKAVLLPDGKSFVKMDNRGYAYSSEDSINSFTIEFYLNPYQIRMNSKVLSKISIYNNGNSSEYSGVRASIIDGKLVWRFDNLFMYNGQYSNITLSAGESLKPNEWRHHSVSFDAKTGKLVKYIDGLEEEVLYLTSSGDINGSPYMLNINNIIYDPLYLGQGFI